MVVLMVVVAVLTSFMTRERDSDTTERTSSPRLPSRSAASASYGSVRNFLSGSLAARSGDAVSPSTQRCSARRRMSTKSLLKRPICCFSGSAGTSAHGTASRSAARSHTKSLKRRMTVKDVVSLASPAGGCANCADTL